jgi:hypothetical protein
MVEVFIGYEDKEYKIGEVCIVKTPTYDFQFHTYLHEGDDGREIECTLENFNLFRQDSATLLFLVTDSFSETNKGKYYMYFDVIYEGKKVLEPLPEDNDLFGKYGELVRDLHVARQRIVYASHYEDYAKKRYEKFLDGLGK